MMRVGAENYWENAIWRPRSMLEDIIKMGSKKIKCENVN
jgi:hypothetical protein